MVSGDALKLPGTPPRYDGGPLAPKPNQRQKSVLGGATCSRARKAYQIEAVIDTTRRQLNPGRSRCRGNDVQRRDRLVVNIVTRQPPHPLDSERHVNTTL